MYGDAGYGQNWLPVTNEARRLDPYARLYTLIACLFAIGLVLLIIVVLSLIPLYISHDSKPKSNNISVFRVFVNAYILQVLSPVDDFNSSIVLDQSINQQALQAALTSLIQKDPSVAGAILEISPTSSRQASTSLEVICDLSITSNRSCVTTACSSQFQSSFVNLLMGNNQTTSPVRYQQTSASSSTTISWLHYQLPSTFTWNVSIVTVDPHTLFSSLQTLLSLDQTLNQERLNTTLSPMG